jgi:hypothetical protein
MNDLDKFVHKDFIQQELKFSDAYRYVEKYIPKTEANVQSYPHNPNVMENNTIWVLWLQGMENASKLVKKCFESLNRYKPNDFNIIILDKSNIGEYIKLPDYIWDKYYNGIISATHLSDIIRMELLYVYGGCWVDATVYCMDAIPKFMIQGELFMFKLAAVVTDPILKMSSWWMYAKKGNRLIGRTIYTLYDYWKYENNLIDYFALHIIMSNIIDNDLECKRLFADIPYFNSGNAQILSGKLASPYNIDEWEIIKYTSPIQKLSYKKRYLRGDLYNVYCAIIDDNVGTKS